MTISPFETQEALKINETRAAFLRSFLPELIRQTSIITALDAGCGALGFFSRVLKDLGLQVIAFDVRSENVAEASKRNPDVKFKVEDVEKPSVLGLGLYDLVLCFGLLYHLENPFLAIRNLYAVAKKYLLIETQIAPYQSLTSVLYEESHSSNQSLNYVVLMPTESTFVKMLYKAGFSTVYLAQNLPNHPQFRGSLTRKKVRTILMASKIDNLEPKQKWGSVEFRLIPQSKLPALSLRNWDTSIGKLLRLGRETKAMGLCLFDYFSRLTPASFASKICAWITKPMTLRLWPGWYLGAGQSHMQISILIRKLLWRWFSTASEDNFFILKWHNGIKIRAYPKTEICRALFITGYYEPNEFYFLNNILKPGMVFIDVGANLGLYSLFASNLIGGRGTVLAIEPSEREFKRLKENIDLNHSTNVRPVMLALSISSSERELLIAEERHSGHNTFGMFAYEGVQSERKQLVKTEKLDDLVKKEGLNQVDVIKIDVEGHELFVLEGAKETLSNFHPIVLMEVLDRGLIHQECSSSQLLDFLLRLGYRIFPFRRQTGLPVALTGRFEYFASETILAIHDSNKFEMMSNDVS